MIYFHWFNFADKIIKRHKTTYICISQSTPYNKDLIVDVM